ncbi:MAG: OmpA family protein [Flavobacteriales bacterium]|nr:OmpA family protein [Flavobacteriales bacterium]
MNKTILIFFLFLSSLASAQDTLNFDLSLYNGTGKFKLIKLKSKMTGLTSTLKLQTGKWTYLDSDDVLRIEGNYKVKNKKSVAVGLWKFYDKNENLVMTLQNGGAKQKVRYYRPAVILTSKGYDIITETDSGELNVSHYILPGNGVYTVRKQSAWASDSFNSIQFDSLIKYEKAIKDRSLINPSYLKANEGKINMVSNPGFESNRNHNQNFVEINNNEVTDWYAAAGTPDYYYGNAYQTMQGNASAGCRFYTEQGHHIEFLTNKLKETLKPGAMYCFSMSVKLRESSHYASNALGVLFHDKVQDPMHLIYGKIKPNLKNHGGKYLIYKTEWMTLSCTYTAKGTEKLLTIGSFANAFRMDKISLKGNMLEAYYYVDNIHLVEIEKPEECPCSFGEEQKIEKKKFVVKNIFFENDRWELLPASYIALDSLYGVIKKFNIKEIEIAGHTSNTGTRERNTFLSQKRAESVRDYLIQKGLDKDLFICKGYGPDEPIDTNETEEGRANNRRVEFEILQLD